MTVAEVRLWGTTIGAVSQDTAASPAAFEYEPDFADRGVEIAPLTMPLGRRVYTFPQLGREAFQGLPGLLADALPDRYGNALIDAWLASQGREPGSFSAVERLCYVGTRAMGALEFVPSTGPRAETSNALEVDALVRLASEALTDRAALVASFSGDHEAEALRDILRVGTSAGGARAKAVIAWNPTTQEVRSGQVDVPAGFEHWLLKFDGVRGNGDHGLRDPEGFGAIELAYAQMATAAGIAMSECQLLEEHGRRHFMTRRFDRTATGGKLHMQSLGALAHLDYNQPDVHTYEQAFLAIRTLGLDAPVAEEQFRRMAFNVVARNQDDHVKNVAFLMDRRGTWSLSPAYDLTYAYDPSNRWMRLHQMSVNGKRDAFTLADFVATGRVAGIKQGRPKAILREVTEVVQRWPDFASACGVPEERVEQIGATHRLRIVA
ncbi:MAG: type II toxin-antitoxin system HipA family toxin [Solirubrobacteraceae bacterium]|nr:type II toxin-antitoxin system HipA family toxin [Patulibacter sp.]